MSGRGNPINWCSGRDLNPHVLSDTRSLTWRVYQFRHLSKVREITLPESWKDDRKKGFSLVLQAFVFRFSINPKASINTSFLNFKVSEQEFSPVKPLLLKSIILLNSCVISQGISFNRWPRIKKGAILCTFFGTYVCAGLK